MSPQVSAYVLTTIATKYQSIYKNITKAEEVFKKAI